MHRAGDAAKPDRGNHAEPVLTDLPERVRRRVLALASDVLGHLPADQVPARLVRIARFTPSRRRQLGGQLLASTLDADPVFRQRVGQAMSDASPELVAALQHAVTAPSATAADLATAAYLLRPPGWSSVVTAGEQATAADRKQAAGNNDRALEQLRSQLSALRAAGRTELDRVRRDLSTARSDNDELRRRLREETERARRAAQEFERARAGLLAEQAAAARRHREAEAELRRLQRRMEALEDDLVAARRATREGRSADDVRLRMLVDTLVGAARGIGHELALPPSDRRPADTVVGADPSAAGREASPPWGDVPVQGRDPDDPALLDALLGVPGVHVVVDGYNVTKAAYGELPLEVQRQRLLSGLGALVAQTRVEVTCVFDGVDRVVPVAPLTPRGVRLLFSPSGQSADELIRRLVRAEPRGRPVVVVSSDREVADGVRRAGARPVPSAALARRLARA